MEKSDTIYKKPLWKHYKGVEYIEMDFRPYNKFDELVIRHYREACDMVLSRPDKSVRIFVNIEGVNVSTGTMRILQDIGKSAQRGVKKSAVIGVYGIKVLMIKFYVSYSRSKLKIFTHEEAAMKYIIHD